VHCKLSKTLICQYDLSFLLALLLKNYLTLGYWLSLPSLVFSVFQTDTILSSGLTGDNSKALIKVHDYLIRLGITNHSCKVCLAAIAGYVPSGMVHCVAAFLDTFYIAHQNTTISLLSLNCLEDCIQTFHQLYKIFVNAGVPISLSLPCQHPKTPLPCNAPFQISKWSLFVNH
jgi:hypothetical protein